MKNLNCLHEKTNHLFYSLLFLACMLFTQTACTESETNNEQALNSEVTATSTIGPSTAESEITGSAVSITATSANATHTTDLSSDPTGTAQSIQATGTRGPQLADSTVDATGTAFSIRAAETRAVDLSMTSVSETPIIETPLIPTVTPQPTVEIYIFAATPSVVQPGDIVTFNWRAQGSKATFCPTARYVLFTEEDCLDVPLAGTLDFTIPVEAAGFPTVDFLLKVESPASSQPQIHQLSIELKCELTWFFSSDPQAGICPNPPISSYAAVQHFERGMMIWLEQFDRFIILESIPLFVGESRKQAHIINGPLEITGDSSADIHPPAGFYAPESGFGLVWRGDVTISTGFQEQLGWALAPEFGYDAVFQCDNARPSGGRSWQTCYLLADDGEIIVFHPLGGWYFLGEE